MQDVYLLTTWAAIAFCLGIAVTVHRHEADDRRDLLAIGVVCGLAAVGGCVAVRLAIGLPDADSVPLWVRELGISIAIGALGKDSLTLLRFVSRKVAGDRLNGTFQNVGDKPELPGDRNHPGVRSDRDEAE